MKVKLFSNYMSSAESEINRWLSQSANINIDHILYSTCCTSSGTVYHQVAIFYTEGVKI